MSAVDLSPFSCLFSLYYYLYNHCHVTCFSVLIVFKSLAAISSFPYKLISVMYRIKQFYESSVLSKPNSEVIH